jgi:hypothetical protein
MSDGCRNPDCQGGGCASGEHSCSCLCQCAYLCSSGAIPYRSFEPSYEEKERAREEEEAAQKRAEERKRDDEECLRVHGMTCKEYGEKEDRERLEHYRQQKEEQFVLEYGISSAEYAALKCALHNAKKALKDVKKRRQEFLARRNAVERSRTPEKQEVHWFRVKK